MVDVAREAGCSQATVSFVLNGVDGVKISPETRERVVKIALAMGYTATTFRALEQQPSPQPAGDGTIGFLVDQIATSPEAAIAIDSAHHEAWRTGRVLVSAQTGSDAVMEPKAIETLLSLGATSLIYMTIITRELRPHPMLYTLDIPVVLLNCYTQDHAFASVIPSEIAGGQTATRHLIEHGHRRIATIVGEMWMDAASSRLEGYRRALATADIPFDPSLVMQGDWSTTGGYDATRRLLALPHPPTAIFCQNDRTALGCYDALREAGLSVPDDVSVVGYDDEDVSRHLRPKLTTCVLPHRAMGRWAVEHLQESERQPRDRRHYPVTKIECSLVTRESVAAPHA
ncbi:LacI family DNA-binding transcriptional regulator [Pararobbsia silviterrae]|uniref:LacI family DNA-binding transcriptional regulator n=2 Tax=Pararobbsia silviterrae TaxID=1792498 RepID=A0A494XW84_9BURK|nr:LacI family DNA-binding transcriptional regulator [Pararobbsia silviterrae]